MFSVVIPLYNKAPHIEATLRSVLSQQLSPAEIIVVDDGSTDGGDRLVNGFSHLGIRLIRQSNQGPGAARNVGAAAASADYVAFLDADDMWLPMHLVTLQQVILRFPQAGIFSTLHQLRIKGRTFVPRSAFPQGFAGKVDDFFSAMSVGLSLINSSTACVRRNSFLTIGGFPTGVFRGEDLIVWMKMALAFGMAHSATVTAIYNRDAVNRSSAFREPEAPRSLLYLRDILSANTLSTKEQRSALQFFRQVAFYAAAGMKVEGDLRGMRAIRSLAAEMKMWSLTVKLTCLLFMPSQVLVAARYLRHSSSETVENVTD